MNGYHPVPSLLFYWGVSDFSASFSLGSDEFVSSYRSFSVWSHALRQIVAWINIKRNKAFLKNQVIRLLILANFLDQVISISLQDWFNKLLSALPRLTVGPFPTHADIAVFSAG